MDHTDHETIRKLHNNVVRAKCFIGEFWYYLKCQVFTVVLITAFNVADIVPFYNIYQSHQLINSPDYSIPVHKVLLYKFEAIVHCSIAVLFIVFLLFYWIRNDILIRINFYTVCFVGALHTIVLLLLLYNLEFTVPKICSLTLNVLLLLSFFLWYWTLRQYAVLRNQSSLCLSKTMVRKNQ